MHPPEGMCIDTLTNIKLGALMQFESTKRCLHGVLFLILCFATHCQTGTKDHDGPHSPTSRRVYVRGNQPSPMPEIQEWLIVIV